MKIAIVLFNLATEAGASRLLFSFAQSLKKQGNAVVIFTADYNPNCFPVLSRGLDIREIKGDIPFSSVFGSKTTFGKILGSLRLYKLAALNARRIADAMENDFDIVNCHTDFSYRVGALYKKRNPKAKFIWTMHDSPFDFNPKKGFIRNISSKIFYAVQEKIERRFFKKADIAVVIDNRNKEIAEKELGLNTRILRGGVDFESFYRPVKSKPDSKKIALLSVGSLGRYRRFEDVISATAILRKKGYDARTLLVCQDFWADKIYREEFESFIENSGIKNYIDARFEGVAEKDFMDVYRQSDVYIYATHIKIWGIAPFEAMSAGLPLVVCSGSSDAEVLKDGENALFFEPLNPNQLAEKVEILMKDSSFYGKITSNGQRFVKENVSWDAYARGFIEIALGNK
ncbi:MAG: glycosyltransferase family 4 protein [Patescibacteria group bacterium]